MTISEGGFSDRVLLLQTVEKNELRHEILEGDASGTLILTHFDSVKKGTKITSNVYLQLQGPLSSVLTFISEDNFRSAFETVLDTIEQYVLNS